MTIAFLLARQRSGTGALGSVLQKHPNIFYVGEVFHPDNIDTDKWNYFRFLRDFGIEPDKLTNPDCSREVFDTYCDFLKDRLDTKVIVIDVKYRSFHHFTAGWRGIFEQPWFLSQPYVKKTPIIHLTRNNLVETFVSGRLAEINKVWHASKSSQIKETSVEVPLKALKGYLNSITREVNQVSEWLSSTPKLATIEYANIFDEKGFIDVPTTGKLAEVLGVSNFRDRAPAFLKQAPSSLRDSIKNYREVEEGLRETSYSWMMSGKKDQTPTSPQVQTQGNVGAEASSKIGTRNNAAVAKIPVFRQERGTTPVKLDQHFHKTKNANPYLGFVDCRSAGQDFTMFSANDDLFAMSYFWFGEDAYQKTSMRVWEEAARNARCILDVGAFTGGYSLVAAKANPNAQVHAFEPARRSYARLVMNVHANDLQSRISAHCVAIGARSQGSHVYQYNHENILGNAASLMPSEGREVIDASEKVQVLSLNNLCSKLKIKPDLIKIDVEGSEVEVLMGARSLLSTPGVKVMVNVRPDTAPKAAKILGAGGNDKLEVIDETIDSLAPLGQVAKDISNVWWTSQGLLTQGK
ncbi:FkbM family methyltransferase [Shimia thalassica]|uniref:FkbM family methyltransferase n=1 Tax=Shimia thalassica TaxID=1715693 RepID=UPI002734DD27|nr:FkbM family methyltransferase [Shimia thalassica]MDP2520802.1 FkbM family methyltransferase [Shimia thalassica]